MNNLRREWTQNEDEVLKRMIAEGASLTLIAQRLGPDFSRNAVAGRASRLQIRSSNPRAFASGAANPARRKQAGTTVRPIEKYETHKTVETLEVVREIVSMDTEVFPVTIGEGKTVECRMVEKVTINGKAGVPFMEARSFHCRTVIGEDVGEDEIILARFCGKQVRKPGESYCPQCHSKFFVPARRK
jgi:hypothetical protein